MEEKILVAYASKYGATAEIARRIGGVLSRDGLQVEVLPAQDVESLSGYRAVVLGSAVYAGQWRAEAAQFLKENEQALKALPVWLFSSGPTGEGDPVELMKGWRFPETLQQVAERVEPNDIAFFMGQIDMHKLNLLEQMVVKAIKAPAGDFRDWDSIESWAASITEELKKNFDQG